MAIEKMVFTKRHNEWARPIKMGHAIADGTR
jgi:hypothetical protein